MTPRSWESDGAPEARAESGGGLSVDVRQFPNAAGSVTHARRFVQEHLTGAPKDLVDAIAVMTSELATNSVRHADSAFEVGVDRTPDAIRIEVTDAGPGTPVVRAPEPAGPSGRGLYIVEQLADEWGVRRVDGTGAKTVWFTVALH